MTGPSTLPFVDEHTIAVDAPCEVAWGALERYAAAACAAEHRLLTRLLGAEPRSGFAIVEREPLRRLTLAGRHRFARYRLAFALVDGGTTTELSAATYAAFPGVRARAYRGIVISSGAHAVVTKRMLHSIRRLAVTGRSPVPS